MHFPTVVVRFPLLSPEKVQFPPIQQVVLFVFVCWILIVIFKFSLFAHKLTLAALVAFSTRDLFPISPHGLATDFDQCATHGLLAEHPEIADFWVKSIVAELNMPLERGLRVVHIAGQGRLEAWL